MAGSGCCCEAVAVGHLAWLEHNERKTQKNLRDACFPTCLQRNLSQELKTEGCLLVFCSTNRNVNCLAGKIFFLQKDEQHQQCFNAMCCFCNIASFWLFECWCFMHINKKWGSRIPGKFCIISIAKCSEILVLILCEFHFVQNLQILRSTHRKLIWRVWSFFFPAVVGQDINHCLIQAKHDAKNMHLQHCGLKWTDKTLKSCQTAKSDWFVANCWNCF